MEVATVGLATVLPVHQLPAVPPVETVELGLESEDLVVVLGELLLVLRLVGLRLREVGLVLLLVAVEVLELGPEEWPELVKCLVVESQLGLAQYCCLLPSSASMSSSSFSITSSMCFWLCSTNLMWLVRLDWTRSLLDLLDWRSLRADLLDFFSC